jgi:hypothetical protein
MMLSVMSHRPGGASETTIGDHYRILFTGRMAMKRLLNSLQSALRGWGFFYM